MEPHHLTSTTTGRRPSATRRAQVHEPDPQRVWDRVGARVSSASMRLRAIRSRYHHSSEVTAELDGLIRQLDDVFSAVMRAEEPPPDGAVARPLTSELARPRDPSQARLCSWISVFGATGGVEPVVANQPSDIDALLDELADDRAPLPAAIAGALVIAPGASFADAVQRLRWARHTPSGPRCRTYRSALLFLADADPDSLPPPGSAAVPATPSTTAFDAVTPS